MNYDGTLLFGYSHDRAFLDNVVNKGRRLIRVLKAKAKKSKKNKRQAGLSRLWIRQGGKLPNG